MKLIGKYWRVPKIMWGLFGIEFAFTVATLALFGIADPDTYRNKLWQEGADHGFNSDPGEILLSYANHNPINPPLIWSQFLTTYNVVISVFSMFVLLTKTVMFILHIFIPPLSIVIHSVLIAIYSYSIYAQSSSDTTDPLHKQTGAPWYLTKSCSVSSTKSIKGYCEQAKASFAVTIIMTALFVGYLAYSILSNFTGRKPADEADEDEFTPSAKERAADDSPDGDWEMQDFKRSNFAMGSKDPAAQPFTPRTTAFHRLGGAGAGDLPLRR